MKRTPGNWIRQTMVWMIFLILVTFADELNHAFPMMTKIMECIFATGTVISFIFFIQVWFEESYPNLAQLVRWPLRIGATLSVLFFIELLIYTNGVR